MGNQNEREVSRGLGVGGRNQRCSKKRWSLCHWESIGEGGALVKIFEKPK